MNRDWHAYWNARAFTGNIGRKEALRQVGKTVLGQPIDAEQVNLLVHHIKTTLDLGSDDQALDLGCGNGLITSLLAENVQSVLGIDYAEALIQTARHNHSSEGVRYRVAELTNLQDAGDFSHINKVWSCEVLHYIDPEKYRTLLAFLSSHLRHGYRILMSGIPDKDRIRSFYNTPERWTHYQESLARGEEQIGYWWLRSEVENIARQEGMSTVFVDLPSSYYTAHYRFDVLLEAA